MKLWLVKSEPDVYSIDDFKRDGRTLWDCVRNYQARNFLQSMKVGDLVLFYHSNGESSGSKMGGVAGQATVSRAAIPDPSQYDKKGEYFDPKATMEKPRWFAPELKFVEKFSQILPLTALRKEKPLKNMMLLRPGSRLSVQPVTEDEFQTILAMAKI